MADGYFLSEQDKREIANTIKTVRGLPPNKTSGKKDGLVDYKTPDLFIAKPRDEAGITALTPAGEGTYDVAGSGVCNIYKIVDNAGSYELQPVDGPEHMVFNLSESEITSGSWIQINRDKFGRWIANLLEPGDPETEEPGTGTGTGTGLWELEVITDIRVEGLTIQIKTRTIDAYNPSEESDWTTIHTGTSC